MKLYYLLDKGDIYQEGDEIFNPWKEVWEKIEKEDIRIGNKVYHEQCRRPAKPWCSMCGVELDGVYCDRCNQTLKDLNK